MSFIGRIGESLYRYSTCLSLILRLLAVICLSGLVSCRHNGMSQIRTTKDHKGGVGPLQQGKPSSQPSSSNIRAVWSIWPLRESRPWVFARRRTGDEKSVLVLVCGQGQGRTWRWKQLTHYQYSFSKTGERQGPIRDYAALSSASFAWVEAYPALHEQGNFIHPRVSIMKGAQLTVLQDFPPHCVVIGPSWSSDGAIVAWLSTDSRGGKPAAARLWTYLVSGSKLHNERVITAIGAVAWSQDNNRLGVEEWVGTFKTGWLGWFSVGNDGQLSSENILETGEVFRGAWRWDQKDSLVGVSSVTNLMGERWGLYRFTLQGHRNRVGQGYVEGEWSHPLAVSPSRLQLAYIVEKPAHPRQLGQRGRPAVQDCVTGKVTVCPAPYITTPMLRPVWSPDGNALAIVTTKGEVFLWEIESGKVEKIFP